MRLSLELKALTTHPRRCRSDVTVAKIMARILSKYAVSSCLQVIHSADARSFDEGQAILSLGAYIGVHSWLAEHDARLLAVQQEKISEAILPVLGERQRQLVSAAGTHAMACRTRFPWLAWHRSRAAWRRSRCRPWRSAAG